MTSKFASASVRILKDVDARVFDELKNKLHQTKAWAKSATARPAPALIPRT